MIDSSGGTRTSKSHSGNRVPQHGWNLRARRELTGAFACAVIAVVLASHADVGFAVGDEPALKLRAVPIGAAAAQTPMAIELVRWSTDAERSPLLAALSAPPPAPPAAAAPPTDAPAAAGRAGRAAGRGGRGGRGGAAAPPPNPMARLTSAIKAAPTLGYIWGGVTGYSIKYAWHAPAAGRAERVVLVTDRRVEPQGLPLAGGGEAAANAEFTVIEILLDAKGTGEAKTSLTTKVVVDAAAQTLALDGYPAAPPLLKVTR